MSGGYHATGVEACWLGRGCKIGIMEWWKAGGAGTEEIDAGNLNLEGMEEQRGAIVL